MAVQLQPLAAAVRATGIIPAWIHPGVHRERSVPQCSERHHPADVIPRALATPYRESSWKHAGVIRNRGQPAGNPRVSRTSHPAGGVADDRGNSNKPPGQRPSFTLTTGTRTWPANPYWNLHNPETKMVESPTGRDYTKSGRLKNRILHRIDRMGETTGESTGESPPERPGSPATALSITAWGRPARFPGPGRQRHTHAPGRGAPLRRNA